MFDIFFDNWEFEIWSIIWISPKNSLSFSNMFWIFSGNIISKIVKPRMCNDCFHNSNGMRKSNKRSEILICEWNVGLRGETS